MRTKILDLEISQEITPILGVEGYDSCRILVRHHRKPLGWVWISLPNADMPMLPTVEVRQAVSNQLGWIVMQHVLGSQFMPEQLDSQSPQPISVVICTRDRAEQLARCLQSLLALDYPTYEIIVVDNAPCNNDTAQTVSRLPVRYVCEKRPGLNHARNRGIAEARHNLVAFADDDARVDHFWLQAINRGFASPKVMAVTGFVGPAELETTAQDLFELDYGGMGHGFWRRIIRREALTERELMWASGFGVGVNMAFRRILFNHIGCFDVALDVGTPSGGAGDVEMFHRIVAKGYTIIYEPAMLVWHTHRRTFSALRRQIYDNGRSFGCFLFTCLRNRTVKPSSILNFFLHDWLGKWILRNLIRPPRKMPRKLVVVELAGMLMSPLAYRATQRWARRITTTFPNSDCGNSISE
jgi:glycosyltransferase involved in cell wall biosynthesis